MLKKNSLLKAKPFLRWAGGKSQLLNTIEDNFPQKIKEDQYIEKYFELFVGGGSLYFYLRSKYDMGRAYICDINPDLILAYKVIQNDHKKLIDSLSYMQDEYILMTQEEKKNFYLDIKSRFNNSMKDFDYKHYDNNHIVRASQLIFLNKTCFNGLYRVNKKGEFNVAFGKKDKPSICDIRTIKNVNRALKNTYIINGNYDVLEDLIDENSLVYLDPPYRPLPTKPDTVKYSKFNFDDKEQVKLSNFCKKNSEKGANIIISNSNPKSVDPNDTFFDNIYNGFKIEEVKAKRMINPDKENRHNFNELLIKNY